MITAATGCCVVPVDYWAAFCAVIQQRGIDIAYMDIDGGYVVYTDDMDAIEDILWAMGGINDVDYIRKRAVKGG